jgi:hypothetical protein
VADLTAVEPAAVDEKDSPDALARDHAVYVVLLRSPPFLSMIVARPRCISHA